MLALCTKFGLNIFILTEIEPFRSQHSFDDVTFSFDVWSCGHLHMAVMHHPTKFDADIFIQSGVVDIC